MCSTPFGGMSLSRSTGTIIHHFIFIQEQKGSKMRRYEWKFHFTVFASRRKKKGYHLTLQNQQLHSLLVRILGKGKWEISRNRSLSWPSRFFHFILNLFERKQCQKLLRKCKNIRTILWQFWSWGKLIHLSQHWQKRSAQMTKLFERAVVHFWPKHQAVT